jgi:hypothetical protein
MQRLISLQPISNDHRPPHFDALAVLSTLAALRPVRSCSPTIYHRIAPISSVSAPFSARLSARLSPVFARLISPSLSEDLKNFHGAMQSPLNARKMEKMDTAIVGTRRSASGIHAIKRAKNGENGRDNRRDAMLGVRHSRHKNPRKMEKMDTTSVGTRFCASGLHTVKTTFLNGENGAPLCH